MSGAQPRIFDMHCHLDFDPDPVAAAARAEACGLGAFSCTVEPAAYEAAAAALASAPGVEAGLGLHPWWVRDGAEGQAQLAEFERLAPRARLIGEVGLDFGPRHVDMQEAQLAALERELAACEAAGGGKVISIHAVRSGGAVLDALERHGANRSCACIFHWFSGTPQERDRALSLGCFFSANPRMLQTKRGRAHLRAVPADRLLLETDLPEDAGMPFDAQAVVERLEALLDGIAELREEDRDQLAERVAETSRRLLGL